MSNTVNLAPATDSMSKLLSSTQASVDSDSDYQVSSRQFIEQPSRPESRCSTMSGLSTTATKDGIEGNRIHRSHDPTGYTQWLYPTLTSTTVSSSRSEDNVSSSASIVTVESGEPLNNAPDEENRIFDSDIKNATVGPGIAPVPGSSQGSRSKRLHRHAIPTANPNTNAGAFAPAPEQTQQYTNVHPHFHHHHIHEDPNAPANEPTAPPVTLREKMNLLRTGSVNGIVDSDSESSFSREDEPRY